MMTFIWISSETRSDSQACRRNLRRVVDSAGLDSFAAVFQICLFVAQNLFAIASDDEQWRPRETSARQPHLAFLIDKGNRYFGQMNYFDRN